MDEFLNAFGAARVLSPDQILLSILVSFVLSSLITATYQWTYQGLSYSRGFAHAQILGAMVTGS